MKHSLVIATAAVVTTLLAASAPRAAAAISASALLRDGSAIRGEFRTECTFIDGDVAGTITTQGPLDAMSILSDMQTVMGIPMNECGPSYNNKSSFLIDDLKIWSHDKTEFPLRLHSH